MSKAFKYTPFVIYSDNFKIKLTFKIYFILLFFSRCLVFATYMYYEYVSRPLVFSNS